jgi:uncharacterized protein (TIGR02001 family)
VAAFGAPALADGMSPQRRAKTVEPAPEPRRCTFSANVALTSDYIFRGFSQTGEGPAIQGGFDATCGVFYVGVFASSLDWGVIPRPGPDDTWAYLELDPYAGIKGKLGRLSWDLGVIYYGYPESSRSPYDLRFRNEFLEIKAGLSGDIWKNGTLGATVFYSPDYQYETGNVWTFEVGFAQAFPTYFGFTPTFSALFGYQHGDDDAYRIRGIAFGDDSYTYWNAGLTLGFLEKWSLDLRYWDTDLGNNNGFCTGNYFQCDSRFVAILKYTY